MSDVVMPDISQHALTQAQKILESRPEKEALKVEEYLHAMGKGKGWTHGLKIYLLARIESLRGMTDVDLKGNETMEEIGIRYTLCSAMGLELQDIIAKVEATVKAIDANKDTEKSTTKG